MKSYGKGSEASPDCAIYETDRERAESEAAWLKAHPAITEEEREKMRAMGEKNKAFLSEGSRKKQCQLVHERKSDKSVRLPRLRDLSVPGLLRRVS